MSGTVVPRPIAFVSSLSSEGVANLAPFSYFMIGGSNPPSLCFSVSGIKDGQKKDTLRNIEDTREFVVNLVTADIAVSMNQTSAPYPSHQSEFDVSGLTAVPSQRVKPPRVGESLVQFECKLFQVVSHGREAGSANYVIGEVLMIHMVEELAIPGNVASGAFRPVARMGGSTYIDTANCELFELTRPKVQ